MQGEYQLTQSAIKSILKNPREEIGKSHLLQVYDIKTSGHTTGKIRRTMRFSDGLYFARGVVSSMMPLNEFDIVEVCKFRLTELKGNSIMIVDELSVAFTELVSIIGAPVESNKENKKEGTIILAIPSSAKRVGDVSGCDMKNSKNYETPKTSKELVEGTEKQNNELCSRVNNKGTQYRERGGTGYNKGVLFFNNKTIRDVGMEGHE